MMNKKRVHRSMNATAAGLGVAMAGMCVMSAAALTPITHNSVVVEDFTATWCGPCAAAHDQIDRKKAQWGDELAVLTYNISDPPYSNSYTGRRQGEWGVSAIPTFVFQSRFKQVGVPSDGQFDNYVNSSKNLGDTMDLLGFYIPDQSNNEVDVKLKIRPHNDLTSSHELRVVVWEKQFLVNWYRSDFKYRVVGGLDIPTGLLKGGKTYQGKFSVDAAAFGPFQEWDDLGVTVLLYDRSDKSIDSVWELGIRNLGDMDRDNDIDMADGQAFLKCKGKSLGEQGYNTAADWDYNDTINQADEDLFRAYVFGGGLR